MNRMFLVAKTMYKNSGDIFSSLTMGKNKGKREVVMSPSKKASVLLLVLFIVGSLFFSMYTTGSALFGLAHDAGVMNEMLSIFIPVVLLMIGMFTLTLVTSFFFLSTDTNVFLPLPIKPEEIFFGRLIVSSINAFLIEAVMVVPLLVAYNVVIGPNVLIIFNQILFVVALPFIPLSITFLVALAIGRIFNVAKHKEAFSIIMSSVAILFILVLEFGLSSTSVETTTPDYLVIFADSIRGTASQLSFLEFFTSIPRAGLTDTTYVGTLNMLLFILISVALVALSIVISKGFYMKTLIGNEDRGSKRKKSDIGKELSSETKTTRPYLNLVRSEWRGIVRSPTYIFNLLMPPVLVIVIMSFSMYGSLSAAGDEGTDILAQIAPMLQGAFSFHEGSTTFFAGAAVMFIASMTMISSTAISREGKNAFLIKTWPISPVIQMRAKLTIGTAITAVLLFVGFVAVGIIAQLNPLYMLMSFIPLIILLVVANYAMLLVDAAHPFLDWENETAAVKQNKNGLWGMLICWGIGIVFGGLGFLSLFARINAIWSFLIVTAAAVALLLWIEGSIKKKGPAVFKGIQ